MSTTAAATRPRDGASPLDAQQRATLLGAYDKDQVARQVIAIARSDRVRLVIDWRTVCHGEPRLVGHLDADEPVENARILAEHYLADPSRGRCRRITRGDLRPTVPVLRLDAKPLDGPLRDGDGRVYRIRALPGRDGFPELRWTCTERPDREEHFERLSIRNVIGRLEDYEPARSITASVLSRHDGDRLVSTCRLRGELERVNNSVTVLNRGLREAVLLQLERGTVSMSEIAIRCGRVKHHANGNISGETSWLARRIGTAPDTPGGAPSPWVHTDVLALIARALGLAPHEVELG